MTETFEHVNNSWKKNENKSEKNIKKTNKNKKNKVKQKRKKSEPIPKKRKNMIDFAFFLRFFRFFPNFRFGLGFAAFVLLLYVVLFFLCSIVVVLSFFAIEVACRRRVTTDQPLTFYSHLQLVLPGAFVRLPGAPLYAF